MFVGGQSSREKGEKYEAHAHSCSNHGCSDGRSFGLRDQAGAAAGADHLPRRNDGSGRNGLPDATAASATAAGHLPGWLDASGRLGLSDPAAATAASASAARRRARLSVPGKCHGPLRFVGAALSVHSVAPGLGRDLREQFACQPGEHGADVLTVLARPPP